MAGKIDINCAAISKRNFKGQLSLETPETNMEGNNNEGAKISEVFTAISLHVVLREAILGLCKSLNIIL